MGSDRTQDLRGKEPNSGEDDALGLAIGHYIERLNAGEKVTREEISAAHPQHAEEILDQLRAFVDIDAGGTPEDVFASLAGTAYYPFSWRCRA